VGPNGAGKSTLLRVIALLERPARGEVMFDGAAMSGSPLSYRRKMALVFQEALLLDTTVEANVRTGLSLRGVAREEQRRRVDEWLERFGIAHLRGRSPRTLSGGEAQRASLARAFALQPEVLLLDEPFASLDPPTREALIDDLDAVLTSSRVATVFVTHDRAEALRLGAG
jgi:tungstate transport system ATP-binding protein